MLAFSTHLGATHQRMIKTTRSLILLFALTVQACISASLAADDHMDIEYAETQPLATESMLLDVTRIGNRLVAVGERGHVVISDDGKNWKQAEHVPTRATLTSVVEMGGRLWAGGHDAVPPVLLDADELGKELVHRHGPENQEVSQYKKDQREDQNCE